MYLNKCMPSTHWPKASYGGDIMICSRRLPPTSCTSSQSQGQHFVVTINLSILHQNVLDVLSDHKEITESRRGLKEKINKL